jgi:hypothetical protein
MTSRSATTAHRATFCSDPSWRTIANSSFPERSVTVQFVVVLRAISVLP